MRVCVFRFRKYFCLFTFYKQTAARADGRAHALARNHFVNLAVSIRWLVKKTVFFIFFGFFKKNHSAWYARISYNVPVF